MRHVCACRFERVTDDTENWSIAMAEKRAPRREKKLKRGSENVRAGDNRGLRAINAPVGCRVGGEAHVQTCDRRQVGT